MMKFQAALTTGLAAFFVVPGMTMNQDEVVALENALSGTVRALEVVSGLEKRMQVEPETTIPLIVTATEAPNMPEESLDGRLDTLRQEVSLLRMELDAIESPMAGDPTTNGLVHSPAMSATPRPNTIPEREGPGTAVSAPYSGGLNSSVLDLMRETVKPGSTAKTLEPRANEVKQKATPTYEPGSYTASPLGQAQASYHAGRYSEGALLLEGRSEPRARYWRARCLTRMEEYDEAIRILEELVESAGDTYEGRRAVTDLEFARWKRDFEQNLPQGLRKGKDA